MLLPRSHLKSLLLLIALSLLLSACSRVDLLYRNLDWLIPWRLNDYLDLNRQQQVWFKSRLQVHLNWHCSTELPRALNWLQRNQTLVEQLQPAAGPAASERVNADGITAALAAQFTELDAALMRITIEVTPTAVELLQGLSATQVSELYAALDEKNQDDREKFIDPPLAAQISARAERMEKRLRPWFGRLSTVQQLRIGQWARARGDQNRQWLDNRLRWQQAFRAALQERARADFPARLTRLLQEPEAYADPLSLLAYQHSRQAMAELFSDLLVSTDARQRARLTQRLRALRRDLEQQRCRAPAERV
ncbi:MAG: DUF6279 family lipoprotein [Pseudomonas sp.]